MRLRVELRIDAASGLSAPRRSERHRTSLPLHLHATTSASAVPLHGLHDESRRRRRSTVYGPPERRRACSPLVRSTSARRRKASDGVVRRAADAWHHRRAGVSIERSPSARDGARLLRLRSGVPGAPSSTRATRWTDRSPPGPWGRTSSLRVLTSRPPSRHSRVVSGIAARAASLGCGRLLSRHLGSEPLRRRADHARDRGGRDGDSALASSRASDGASARSFCPRPQPPRACRAPVREPWKERDGAGVDGAAAHGERRRGRPVSGLREHDAVASSRRAMATRDRGARRALETSRRRSSAGRRQNERPPDGADLAEKRAAGRRPAATGSKLGREELRRSATSAPRSARPGRRPAEKSRPGRGEGS